MTDHALRGRTRYPGLIDDRIIPYRWWLEGDISPADCVAAYRAKGVSSYTASKINLNNSEINNLVEGSAPSWTSANGWQFSSGKYLMLKGGGEILKPGTIIARVHHDNSANYRTILGGSATDSCLQYRINNDHKQAILKARLAGVGVSTSAVPNADKVVATSYSSVGAYAFYLDGTLDGSGTNNQTISSASDVVGRNHSTYTEHFLGYIKALAIYTIVLTSDQISAVTTAMQAL